MWADLYELVAIFVLGLIIVAVVVLFHWLSAVLIVGVAGGIMYGVGYMFDTRLWLIDATMPTTMLTLVSLHSLFNRFVKEFMLKQQIKKQFEHYPAPNG